jgi:hypothetical protein
VQHSNSIAPVLQKNICDAGIILFRREWHNLCVPTPYRFCFPNPHKFSPKLFAQATRISVRSVQIRELLASGEPTIDVNILQGGSNFPVIATQRQRRGSALSRLLKAKRSLTVELWIPSVGSNGDLEGEIGGASSAVWEQCGQCDLRLSAFSDPFISEQMQFARIGLKGGAAKLERGHRGEAERTTAPILQATVGLQRVREVPGVYFAQEKGRWPRVPFPS